MDEYLKQLAEQIKRQIQEKTSDHQDAVVKSQQFQQELAYLSDFTFDSIEAIKSISIYSTRAKYIYDEFLTIRATDDLLQSIIGLKELIINGIHNMAKREIRYILEMVTKYLVVDQEKMGQLLSVKTQYLHDSINNSSIDVVDRLLTPFNSNLDLQFKNEIRDIYYKACAYVHPSRRQIEEQLENYSRGIHIGFETAKMLSNTNKLLFRSYDIILTMLFIGFGQSMSGDLFNEIFDLQPNWKFHKGKYLKEFSKIV